MAGIEERRALVTLALGGGQVTPSVLAALVRRGHAELDGDGPRTTPAGVEAVLTSRMWDVLDGCAHGRVEWVDNGSGGAALLGGVPVGGQIGPLRRLGLASPDPPAWRATQRGLLLLALRAAADVSRETPPTE